MQSRFDRVEAAYEVRPAFCCERYIIAFVLHRRALTRNANRGVGIRRDRHPRNPDGTPARRERGVGEYVTISADLLIVDRVWNRVLRRVFKGVLDTV